MDTAQRARRDVVLQGLDVAGLRGVEIGPLDRPLVTKSESTVYYVDHCSTEDLRNKYAADPNVNTDNIMNVDFVWADQPAAQSLANVCPLDYVVASHVVEHVPDLIGWLHEMRDLLQDGGSLILAVPDKRFTFDIQRRTSAMEEIRQAYAERRRRPGLRCIVDHFANSVRADLNTLWEDYGKGDEFSFYNDSSLLNVAALQYAAGQYIDVHCWVFTPWSFLQALGIVAEETGLGLDLERFETTHAHHFEFYVRLVKVAKSTTDWRAEATKAFATALWPDSAGYLNQRLAAAEARKAKLSQANQQMSMELAAALQRAEQADFRVAQLASRITALENSTSWRMTAALRATKGMLDIFPRKGSVQAIRGRNRDHSNR